MSYENILFEKKNRIAYVTLNRPRVLNVLDTATILELFHAFRDIRDDSELRVAILTGSGGKAFAAGADIRELAKNDALQGKAYAERGQALLNLIESCGKPVIACVNGYALGGGCELAMACSLRLASENAQLGLPEVKLGIIPGFGGTQRLPRLVGKGIALQMMLTGDPVGAVEAHRIGLVNEVLPADRLMARAEEIASRIMAVGPVAVRQCIEAVNHGHDLPISEGLTLEASLFGLCCATEDRNEGTTAFLEKRSAQFTGT